MFASCKHVGNLYVCVIVLQHFPKCANILFYTKFELLPNNQICFVRFAFGILIAIVFVLMRDELSKCHLLEVTIST